MAFDSSTVSVGDFTKKSHHDQLLDNTQFNKANITVIQSSTATFQGPKTFQSSTVFNATAEFTAGVGIEIDQINSRTSTGPVAIGARLVSSTSSVTVVAVKQTVIRLGAWDMDADQAKSFNITAFVSDLQNFICAKAFIIKDGEENTWNLETPNGINIDGYINTFASGGDVTIQAVRNGAGFFDNAFYNDTGINRGYLIITHR
ncbi:MAG TPA: hypothetical protein ENH82_01600 [bacterium]|nr:hypothetical protein [bacterium]